MRPTSSWEVCPSSIASHSLSSSAHSRGFVPIRSTSKPCSMARKTSPWRDWVDAADAA